MVKTGLYSTGSVILTFEKLPLNIPQFGYLNQQTIDFLTEFLDRYYPEYKTFEVELDNYHEPILVIHKGYFVVAFLVPIEVFNDKRGNLMEIVSLIEISEDFKNVRWENLDKINQLEFFFPKN